MLNFLLIALVGWPAITVTVILAVIGLLRNNYRFVVAAAILAVPFSWFLSGFPIIRSSAFLLPLILLVSAFALYRKYEMIAWVIAAPFFLSILLLLYVIMVGSA
jgi:hypothetical protein